METVIHQSVNKFPEEESWRRRCGCLRTSEKLKRILDSFPAPPPPTPNKTNIDYDKLGTACISAYCTHVHKPNLSSDGPKPRVEAYDAIEEKPHKKMNVKSWRVMSDIVQLVQLSVTATALALYYLIYCYMQLIYYTLQSALYFHNADGSMKLTIAVVTITSLVVAFNVLVKMERILGFFI